jgi:hypothetical protein
MMVLNLLGGKIGEPGRTRTSNPLLTPEMLCSWFFMHFLASCVTVIYGVRQGFVPQVVPNLGVPINVESDRTPFPPAAKNTAATATWTKKTRYSRKWQPSRKPMTVYFSSWV